MSDVAGSSKELFETWLNAQAPATSADNPYTETQTKHLYEAWRAGWLARTPSSGEHNHPHTCETESECAACELDYWISEAKKAGATPEPRADAAEREDMESIGRALLATIKHNLPDYSWLGCPSEVVVDLMNKLDDASTGQPPGASTGFDPMPFVESMPTDPLAVSHLRGLVYHWNEFGPEFSLDEKMHDAYEWLKRHDASAALTNGSDHAG